MENYWSVIIAVYVIFMVFSIFAPKISRLLRGARKNNKKDGYKQIGIITQLEFGSSNTPCRPITIFKIRASSGRTFHGYIEGHKKFIFHGDPIEFSSSEKKIHWVDDVKHFKLEWWEIFSLTEPKENEVSNILPLTIQP